MTMREAVARFIPDGASVCMGTALEAAIPFAAGHELIRQRRRDLTLIGPISDMLFDQLVGAGCVRRIIAAWVGNVSAGLGHNYRRAVEKGVPAPDRGRGSLEPHAGLRPSGRRARRALPAHAIAARHRPRRSRTRRSRPGTDPWSGAPLLLVPALVPDVAVLHVQRADEDGRAHFWGTLGVTRPAALAARRVIIVAEEIRPRNRILSDPGLVLTPEIKVAAVVHEPFGAYPSPVQGCYRRHHDFFGRFHEESRTVEGNRGLARPLHPRRGRLAGLSRQGRRRRAGHDPHRAPSSLGPARLRSLTMKITAIQAITLAIPLKPMTPAVGVVGGDAQADRRPRLDRRGRDGYWRGLRLRRPAGGREHHRGEPGAPHRGPGSAADRGGGRPHAPRHHDLRPSRARDVRDQRRGDRAVGSRWAGCTGRRCTSFSAARRGRACPPTRA